MSSDLERLRDLLAKTEKNIKIIEAVNGNFALAVLNEWRYSTWQFIIGIATIAGVLMAILRG